MKIKKIAYTENKKAIVDHEDLILTKETFYFCPKCHKKVKELFNGICLNCCLNCC